MNARNDLKPASGFVWNGLASLLVWVVLIVSMSGCGAPPSEKARSPYELRFGFDHAPRLSASSENGEAVYTIRQPIATRLPASCIGFEGEDGRYQCHLPGHVVCDFNFTIRNSADDSFPDDVAACRDAPATANASQISGSIE